MTNVHTHLSLKEVGCEDVHWINLAQERNHCLFLTNTLT
jgi:hypothetical protein